MLLSAAVKLPAASTTPNHDFFLVPFFRAESPGSHTSSGNIYIYENSTILILVESNPSKEFTKFENLNLNFQRFFRYITTFSNFQILKTVFLNAEFHDGPTRYLGHTRDLRRSHKKLLIVPAAPPCTCTCLSCFLFAYVAEI